MLAKKRELPEVVLAVLALVIIIESCAVIILKAGNDSLKLDYASYKGGTDARLLELWGNLSSEMQAKAQLSVAYSTLNSSYARLAGSNTLLKEEVDETLVKINDYEMQIKSSMAWFSSNSFLNITDREAAENMKSYLRNYCVKRIGDECRIKLGCFYLINSNKLGYNYKYDTTTSNAVDKLQSVNDFVKNKGGDCEDYSLFYKAEYNYLVDEECKGIAPENIVLDSWYVTEDSYSKIYHLEFTDYWMLKDTSQILLPKGYVYPNTVCGQVYYFGAGGVVGHCITSFTNKEIKTKEDITALTHAPLIEPQNGAYMGLLNDTSSGISLLMDDKPFYASYIYLVITDSDLFLFSTEHNEWLSYSILNDELAAHKAKLLNLINR